MAEFIFKISDALYNEETGEAVWRPTIKGKLVRCKGCKWFNDIGCAIKIVDDTDKPSEDDFCSFAERREDG